jgi:hypothetical protein
VRPLIGGTAGLLVLVSLSAQAGITPTDEIQVYDAVIEEPGHLGLELHNNYTPIGPKAADFPGGVAADHVYDGAAEWAYGVTDWFEAGAYVPLYSLTGDGKFYVDGAKLRALFVVPHASERSFFYGINFEFSVNSRHWEEKTWAGEVRGIIGFRTGNFDFIVNPILDTRFDGAKNLEFLPAERVAYNVSKLWAVAVEHYADFGPVHGFLAGGRQDQTLFGVVDYKGAPVGIEFGAGHGFTAAGDKLVLKLMLNHDF